MRTDPSRILSLLTLVAGLLTCFAGVAQTASPLDESDYLLNTGDTIQITVHQEPDLSMQILLNKSGQFSYPYLGTISARGKTTEELATELENQLRGDYLIHPSVNVSIVSYRNFYVGGEVRNPGSYPYQPGLTIQQAIVIAGGETEWASSSKYRIQREDSSDSVRANEDTRIYPGDTVTVEAGLF